jgi:hypothetical protein
LRVRTLFIGFTKARIKSITSSIEGSSETILVNTRTKDLDASFGELAGKHEAVFIDRDLDEARLVRILEDVRACRPDIPIVLVYGCEPDGRSYLMANRFDCWLFSENDRMDRTLRPAEIGDALAGRSSDSDIERRLFEVSLTAGPCSTGE